MQTNSPTDAMPLPSVFMIRQALHSYASDDSPEEGGGDCEQEDRRNEDPPLPNI